MSVDAISWAFKQNIKPAAKKFVLVALADNADTHGICFPSYNTIASKTGLSRRAVIDNCNALIASGIIQKSGRNRSNQSTTSNAYLLPIVEGCIDDHPLSSLFSFRGAGAALPLVQELHPLVQELHPPSAGAAPLEPSLNRHITKKEKKALTRSEFMDEVKEEVNKPAFSKIGDLSDQAIEDQAEMAWEYWDGHDKFPAGCYLSGFKGWLRRGIKNGDIRILPKDSNALQGVRDQKPLPPLQDWHEPMEKLVGGAAFRSWFRACWINDNDQLCTPLKFHVSKLKSEYASEVADILPNVAIIHQPYETKEAVTC